MQSKPHAVAQRKSAAALDTEAEHDAKMASSGGLNQLQLTVLAGQSHNVRKNDRDEPAM